MREIVKAMEDELERLGEKSPTVYFSRHLFSALDYYISISSCVHMDVEESTSVLCDRLIKANEDIIGLCQNRIEELKNASTKA